jgi:Fe-S-cluster containining protein
MPATPSLDSKQPRYQCVRCGNCCRWPGDVNVTKDEVPVIAAHLGLTEDAFIQNYTRLNSKRSGLSIIDKPDGECVFLQGANTCLIQPVKPAQCSGFPNVWNFPGWRDVCEAVDVAAA